MIQDNTQNISTVPPGSGLYITGSFGLDLNPDFGNGQSARKAPLPGQGEDWMLRVDVGLDFVNGVGGNNTPIAQIHAGLSDLGDGVSITNSTKFIIVGSAIPSTHTVGGRTMQGFVAAQLVIGNRFFIRVNPWTAPLGRDAVGGTVIGKDLRYLGVIITVPNEADGDFFSGGGIVARLVKSSDVLQDPQDFIYPAGTVSVG